MKNKVSIDRVGGSNKFGQYLRGVKSSYLLNAVPSQRRVITFVFHIKTHRNLLEEKNNNNKRKQKLKTMR